MDFKPFYSPRRLAPPLSRGRLDLMATEIYKEVVGTVLRVCLRRCAYGIAHDLHCGLRFASSHRRVRTHPSPREYGHQVYPNTPPRHIEGAGYYGASGRHGRELVWRCAMCCVLVHDLVVSWCG